jgi:CO/xanthine dehydrogenase Mo-binding subunit
MPPGVSLAQVIEQCAAEANWSDKNGNSKTAAEQWSSYATLPSNPTALRRGRGFACAFKNVGFSFGFPERCEATIELRGKAEIERAILRQAGADVGQGAHTVFQQMTAKALGLLLSEWNWIYRTQPAAAIPAQLPLLG